MPSNERFFNWNSMYDHCELQYHLIPSLHQIQLVWAFFSQTPDPLHHIVFRWSGITWHIICPMIRHQLRMQLDVCAVAILIFAQEGFYIFELRAIQKTALTPLHQGLEEPSEQHADVFCIRNGDLIVTGYWPDTDRILTGILTVVKNGTFILTDNLEYQTLTLNYRSVWEYHFLQWSVSRSVSGQYAVSIRSVSSHHQNATFSFQQKL